MADDLAVSQTSVWSISRLRFKARASGINGASFRSGIQRTECVRSAMLEMRAPVGL